jgi:hypothetical protein
MRYKNDDGLSPGRVGGTGLLIQLILGSLLVLAFCLLAWFLASH